MSQYPPISPASIGARPHRGATILVLGILSLVIPCGGWILGIIAWVMGNADLRDIRAGRVDASGHGLAQAGKVCGMISVLLHALVIVLWLMGGLAFLTALVGAGAAAAGHR